MPAPGAGMTGRVWLVGAGPGEPGLITVRGLEALRRCDAVVYDRLVAPELVDEAPADVLRVARDPLSQEEINRLLVRLARRGLDVVRLKGGDPFLFGRGGEEALALVEAGVPFEVVPGVSSLAAVPAAAGIPVTHRGVSSQVTIVNGHGPLDLAALGATPGTLVAFMGLARLEELAAGLVAARPPRFDARRGHRERHAARAARRRRPARSDRRRCSRPRPAGAGRDRRRRGTRTAPVRAGRAGRSLRYALIVRPALR